MAAVGLPSDAWRARRLPLFNRIVYASGSISGNVISRSMDVWLIFYYAPPADAEISQKLPLVAVGALLTAARLLEALDDPLIGWWSDRTTSRWGRRIPFVVLATPFYAIFFLLLWVPPQQDVSAINGVYLFAILLTFHLFSTLSGGPFESLLPEIAPQSRDRVTIVTWQVLFGTIGAFVALVASGVIIDVAGFIPMALTMAVLALGSRYVALGGAWRYARTDVPAATISPVEAVRATFRNDQFLFFLPTFILFNMSISMLTAALPFWASAVLFRDFPADIARLEFGGSAALRVLGREVTLGVGSIVALLAALAIAVVILSLPLVYALAVRFGKAWVYSLAMLMGAAFLPLVAFMGFLPGLNPLVQAFFFMALVGFPMAAVFTFPNAIQADIIDYDEARTGLRREAVYYATQAALEKIAVSLFPILLAGLLLLGSSSENPLGIRLVGPVAGLASFIGFLTFRGYRLPDSVTPDSLRRAGFDLGEAETKAR